MSLEEKPESEVVYQGNKIPRILRIAYAAFAFWAVFYLFKYVGPDLAAWLKK